MASDNNMKAAEAAYGGFLNMLKYGSVAVAVVAIIVIALIS
jgi:Bacterial aa3 type cytochrome c oxidase subunit IV